MPEVETVNDRGNEPAICAPFILYGSVVHGATVSSITGDGSENVIAKGLAPRVCFEELIKELHRPDLLSHS